MNTEATQDHQEANTTGARLRNAREQLGLSQQAVAERLCLKVSTVRDIEEDKAPADLASTFLRGYIRSYARLVHIPEEELLPMMAKQAPIRAAKVAPMQSFSLGKRRKKRDGWLMSFTWLVLFVVIGLSGAWWWQDHKAQQEEITTMADQSSAELNSRRQRQPECAAGYQRAEQRADPPIAPANSAPDDTATAPAPPARQRLPAAPADNNAVVAPSQANVDTAATTPAAPAPPQPRALPTDQANVTTPAAVGSGSGDELFRRLLAGSERCDR